MSVRSYFVIFVAARALPVFSSLSFASSGFPSASASEQHVVPIREKVGKERIITIIDHFAVRQISPSTLQKFGFQLSGYFRGNFDAFVPN